MQQVIYQVGIQNALSATTGSAVSLTMPTGADPTHAIIQVTGNSIRWRADGTAPTATVGLLVAAGTNIELMDPEFNYGAMIANFKAIGISGTATIEVAFYSC
jgi:hypothetical protein